MRIDGAQRPILQPQPWPNRHSGGQPCARPQRTCPVAGAEDLQSLIRQIDKRRQRLRGWERRCRCSSSAMSMSELFEARFVRKDGTDGE